MLFFYSNSNYKSIEKLIFSAFGKIFVLVNAFFSSTSNLKQFEKLIFCSFGQNLLGFDECFFRFKY